MLTTTILVLVITAAAAWAIHRDLQRRHAIPGTLTVTIVADTSRYEAALRRASRALADNMTSRDRAPRYVPRHRAGDRRG